MKCCGKFLVFCNPFSVYLYASEYSKVPKQSCVCRYLSTNRVVKYCLGEKSVVINWVFIMFF
jgi:hypothetical protein